MREIYCFECSRHIGFLSGHSPEDPVYCVECGQSLENNETKEIRITDTGQFFGERSDK